MSSAGVCQPFPSHRVGLQRFWVPGTGVDGTSPGEALAPRASSRRKPGLQAVFSSLLPAPRSLYPLGEAAQLYKAPGHWESGP